MTRYSALIPLVIQAVFLVFNHRHLLDQRFNFGYFHKFRTEKEDPNVPTSVELEIFSDIEDAEVCISQISHLFINNNLVYLNKMYLTCSSINTFSLLKRGDSKQHYGS
jgi:hypothetical protein